MDNYVLMNELAKERHADLLREAERTRRVLRSRRIGKLPQVWKSLVLFLISFV